MAQKNVKITFEVDGIEKTVNSVEELNDALNDTNKEVKEAGKQQGFFAKQSDALKERMDGLKATLGEVKQGFKNGVAGLKNFVSGFKTAGGAAKNFGRLAKGALAATGIGLLIVAVVSLIDYFSNLEGGAKALQKIMKGLGAIVSNVSKAFSLVVQGKFGEAFDTLKNAVVEATEAVDAQFEAEQKLADLRQKNIIQNAELTQEIEKQKKILEDSTLSTNERLAALEKVNEATRQLAQNQMDETKLLLAQAEAELVNISNYEERRQKQEEIAQLQADLIDQTTQLQNIEYDAARVGREIRAAEFEDKKKKLEEEEALREAMAQKEYERQEKLTEKQRDEQKKRMDLTLDMYAREAKAAKQSGDQRNKTEELIARTKEEIMTAAVDTAIEIAGRESVIGKGLAVAAATRNTYQAATNALANTPAPPPFPQIAAGVTVAQGLLQVKNILKTNGPLDSGAGGSTPSIAAPSVSGFSPEGTSASAAFEAQNPGETLSLTQQGSQTAFKAYVVAEEMTSTQEANKKIDDLSRL